MKESEIQRNICEYLKLKGYFFWRNNTVGIFDPKSRRYRRLPPFAKAGVPDIILIHKGKFVGLEVKTEKGVLSENQVKFRLECRAAGGYYFVIRSLNDLLGSLKEIE